MPPLRHIGPFELIEKIGAGGMGEVFKARDQRLQRFVALKFLPESANAAARERFQREALAIAALNHPNICALHEIGEDRGRPYLVLELLEGETLYQRLQRGPVPIAELAQWGAEVTDALQAAHAKGILHRDLKPSNIFITARGAAKVLDFGLAQMEAPPPGSAAEAATLQAGPLTTPGTTLGTLAYMSPEQARGQATDARSDIFSLGVVTYEMASGSPPFRGATALDVSAAILRETPPPPSTTRSGLPPLLDGIVARCLEKDPDLRYQSAADLRGEMKRLLRESSSAAHATPPASSSTMAPAAPAVRGRSWLWPAVAALVMLAGGLAYWRLRPRAAALPPQLNFRQLTFSGNVVDAVISPDGKFLAHVDNGPAGTSLRLQSVVNGSDTQIMQPAPGCCQSPSFSPDGSQVVFLEGNAIKSVPVLGGAVHTLATEACSGAGFSPDGSQIAWIAHPGTQLPVSLMLARADGSQARVLAHAAAGQAFLSQCWFSAPTPTHSPAWSPDGRWIAVEQSGASGEPQLLLISAANGQVQPLGPGFATNPADLNWLPDGSGLVFTANIPDSANSQVWEVSYPAGILTRITNDLQGYLCASLAATTGGLALIHAAPEASIWVQSKPGGEFQQLPGGGTDRDGAAGLDWTPTGLISLRQYGGQPQLWAEAADGSGAHAVATLPPTAYHPSVAPNGQIIFGLNATTATVWRMNGDGTAMQQLMPLPAGASAYTPNLILGGGEVEYMLVGADGKQSLWAVPLAGGAPRQLWAGAVYAGRQPISPDGTRVAVRAGSVDSQRATVIVRLDGSLPQVTSVPAMGANYPEGWTPDGRALVYKKSQGTTDNLWAQPIAGGAPYAITHFTDLNIAAEAWSHDGRLAVSRGSHNQDVVLATGIPGDNRH